MYQSVKKSRQALVPPAQRQQRVLKCLPALLNVPGKRLVVPKGILQQAAVLIISHRPQKLSQPREVSVVQPACPGWGRHTLTIVCSWGGAGGARRAGMPYGFSVASGRQRAGRPGGRGSPQAECFIWQHVLVRLEHVLLQGGVVHGPSLECSLCRRVHSWPGCGQPDTAEVIVAAAGSAGATKAAERVVHGHAPALSPARSPTASPGAGGCLQGQGRVALSGWPSGLARATPGQELLVGQCGATVRGLRKLQHGAQTNQHGQQPEPCWPPGGCLKGSLTPAMPAGGAGCMMGGGRVQAHEQRRRCKFESSPRAVRAWLFQLVNQDSTHHALHCEHRAGQAPAPPLLGPALALTQTAPGRTWSC